jgi:Lar family restriction alleviation protein
MIVKPCPFCGSTDIIITDGTSYRWIVAKCNSCDAQSGEVRSSLDLSTKVRELKERSDAFAEWNKRP